MILENVIFIKSKGTPPGYGGWSLAAQIRAARKLGIQKIDTFADGHYEDELFKGYYVWPRYGFDAELPDSVKKMLPLDLEDSKTVLDVMRTPAGRAWWYVNGGSMEMHFDLRDGSRSVKVLKAYMLEKGFKDIGL